MNGKLDVESEHYNVHRASTCDTAKTLKVPRYFYKRCPGLNPKLPKLRVVDPLPTSRESAVNNPTACV